MSAEDTAGDAARIRERIAELDAERAALTRELVQRWDNTRTGKSGYQPACANEWKPGVCEKPRIKCGEDGLATAAAQDQATAGEPAASTPVAGRLTLFANRITE